MPTRRLAFVAPLDEDDEVEWDADGGWCHVAANHPFAMFAVGQGWRPIALPESYEDGDRAVREWQTLDHTVVRLTLDTIIAVSHVELQGDSIETTEAVIRAAWECGTSSDVLSALKHLNTLGEAQAKQELRRLAVTGPRDPDARVVEMLEGAVRDPRPRVRSAAMTVVQYLKWQELRPSVEEVLRLDPDDVAASSVLFLLDLVGQAEGG
ncbi:hypothetical protein ACH4U7_24015 [Streptomyces sp. NPDC020845]|uniref:hypothetical protein n=1 Tax=Streptomyces sp. NPDC020845 TaxID=3365096 RepID=UPI0037AD6F34